MDNRYRTLLNLDRALVGGGLPPLTPFWKQECQRFFDSDCRNWFVQAGRGAIKSTTAVRIALAEVLGHEWRVPRGEVHYFVFVSASKEEAFSRLQQMQTYLGILRIPFSAAGDTISLGSLPLGFKVLGCQVASVSGPRCVGVFLDECAKWTNTDDGSNPVKHVVASARAMTVTHASGAHLFAFSSPMSKTTWHYEQVEKGDISGQQIVSVAASWEANPSISEAETHAIEPDHKTWRREYAGLAQDATSAAFESEPLDACVTRIKRRGPNAGGRYGLAIDIGIKKDRTALLVFHSELRSRPNAPPLKYLCVDVVEWLVPKLLRPVSMTDVEERIVSLAREYKLTKVHSDSREAASLGERLKGRGLTLVEMPMAVSAQEKRASTLMGRVANGTLDLLDDPELLKEMKQAETHLSGGHWLISAPNRRSCHDDGLDCLLLASEVAQTLPATGGNIVVSSKILYQDGMPAELQHNYYERRRDANGRAYLMPSAPPEGTPDFEIARIKRLRSGTCTDADLRDLGEAKCLQLMQGSADPEAAEPSDSDLIYELEGGEFEFPISPLEEQIHRQLNRPVR